MTARIARITLLILIAALLLAACINPQPTGAQLTATFGAEVFHAQLTAISQETPNP